MKIKPLLINKIVQKIFKYKTETRRVIKADIKVIDGFIYLGEKRYSEKEFVHSFSKIQNNDILWVREPVKIEECSYDGLELSYRFLNEDTIREIETPERFLPKEGDSKMPKWIENKQGVPNGCIKEMARIKIQITNIRIQRLDYITFKEIQAEGLYPNITSLNECFCTKRASVRDLPNLCTNCIVRQELLGEDCDFRKLWDATAIRKYQWSEKPYVFVYTFKVIS